MSYLETSLGPTHRPKIGGVRILFVCRVEIGASIRAKCSVHISAVFQSFCLSFWPFVCALLVLLMEAVFPVNGSTRRTDPSFCRQQQNPIKTSKQQAQHESPRSCCDDGVWFCCRHRTHLSTGKAMTAGTWKSLMLSMLWLLWLSSFMAAS